VLGLFGRGRYERAGFQLYTATVQAAREPYFYAALDVPDTLDGRFDLVGLYACMVIRRLRGIPPKGPALAQAVFDAMFSDMDINLREMGVGDMNVAKKIRAMWEAFHGRAVAYEAPLAAYDTAALEEAVTRNVWRGEPAPGAAALARIAVAQMRALDAMASAELLAGRVSFMAPQALDQAVAA
jgi:cytochrome b pre-mRNA-processing protein 3